VPNPGDCSEGPRALAFAQPRIDAEKQALKAEMTEWLLVWLDDPALFPVWARARRAALDRK